MADEDYKQAKADEKAARKRARALRPWYKKKRFILGIPIVAIVILVAIGSAAAPKDEDPDPLAAAVAGAGSEATYEASGDVAATAEPTKAAAPARTATPAPTPEPPIVFEGVGDDIVTFEPKAARIVHITGNASSRYFGVIPYKGDERKGSLVNTTDPYDGIVPLDFYDGDHTDSFEIKSEGPWRIEILPLSSARVISTSLSGTGDEVLIVNGQPSRALIKGNASSRYFGVRPYGGSSSVSLVNTTDPYEGRVRIPSGTKVLEVKSEGGWEITFE